MDAYRQLTSEVSVRRFLQCLGAYLIHRALVDGQHARLFWGAGGLAEPVTFGTRIFGEIWFIPVLLGALLTGGILLIVGQRTRLAAALASVAFCFLHARLPVLSDAGDHLARTLLLISLALRPATASTEPPPLLHDCAVIVLSVQTVVTYLAAGLAKAVSGVWLNGEVIHILAKNALFTNVLFRCLDRPGVSALASVGIVLHQVLWPLAIFTPLRRSWVMASAFFHLCIGFFMGLMPFALAMLALDALFYYGNPLLQLWTLVRPRHQNVDLQIGAIASS